MSPEDVDCMLNKESGLKGISGISNDMRKLICAAARNNKYARLAIEIFKYRVQKYICAYAGILGRADAIVFTAGIGENQPKLVRGICKGIFNNFKIKPRIMTIPTDEELMIARQTYNAVKGRG